MRKKKVFITNQSVIGFRLEIDIGGDHELTDFLITSFSSFLVLNTELFNHSQCFPANCLAAVYHHGEKEIFRMSKESVVGHCSSDYLKNVRFLLLKTFTCKLKQKEELDCALAHMPVAFQAE